MAVIVSVHNNQAAIHEFLYGPAGPMVGQVRRWGEDVRNAAVRRAPRDTGRLANSHNVTVGIAPGLAFAVISNTASYSLAVHEGTGIFGPTGRRITPVRAKALRFEAGRSIGPLPRGGTHLAPGSRGVVFARSVKGTPPNPWLVDALEEVMGGVGGAVFHRFRR